MDTEEDIVIGKNMQTKSIHEQREREEEMNRPQKHRDEKDS